MNERCLLVVFIMAGALLTSACVKADGQSHSPGQAPSNDSARFVADELFVQFKGKVEQKTAERILVGSGARIIERFPELNTYVIKLPPGSNLQIYKASYESKPEVAHASPNYIRR